MGRARVEFACVCDIEEAFAAVVRLTIVYVITACHSAKTECEREQAKFHKGSSSKSQV